MHPIPSFLNPKSDTLYPTPYVLCPIPYTLYHIPYILNPKSETWAPKPRAGRQVTLYPNPET